MLSILLHVEMCCNTLCGLC